MGKGKKQKQLSPEEQRERAEKRRIANGGAPPGDKSSAPGGGGGRRARGHRQKGGGTVMKSRGDITVSGVVMKEWQRTPKQLLHEWAQKQKRPRPQYQTRPAKPASQHRVSVYLLDKKNKERSLRATPDQSFHTVLAAQHAAALMMLQSIDASIPHERKLPEPFRTMWLELVGRAGTKEVKMSKKELKKAKAAAKRAAEAAKKAAVRNGMSAPADGANIEFSDSMSSTSTAPTRKVKPIAADPAPAAPSAPVSHSSDRGRGAPKEAVSLTTTQKYASHYERRQAYEAKDAARAAKRRTKERKKRDNPDAAVVMSEANRMYVQDILKKLASGQSGGVAADAEGDSMARGMENPELVVEMQSEIESLGFSSEQAVLALRWRGSSVSEALTWLMLNIPEEDLPSAFEPGRASKIGGSILFSEARNTTGQSMKGDVEIVKDDTSSSSAKTGGATSGMLSKRQALCEPEPGNALERKLVECGFELALAVSALSAANGSYPAALEKLYSNAFSAIIKSKGECDPISDDEGTDSDDDEDADPLADEVMVLESMFPDTAVQGPVLDEERGGKMITLKMGAELGLMFDGEASVLDMWLPSGSAYPKTLRPSDDKMGCIVLVRNPSFDAPTRRSVTRAVLGKMHEIFKETGGRQGVLYEMTQWCEKSLKGVVEWVNVLGEQVDTTVTAEAEAKHPSGSGAVEHRPHRKRRVMQQQQGDSSSNKASSGGQKPSKKRAYNRSHITHIHARQERDALSRELKAALDGRPAKARADPNGFGHIASVRARLPAGKHSKPIVKAICDNRVVLIAGETGCGKTTQVPQFVLDDLVAKGQGGDCNIVCTQPRRIAAIGVAERVAK